MTSVFVECLYRHIITFQCAFSIILMKFLWMFKSSFHLLFSLKTLGFYLMFGLYKILIFIQGFLFREISLYKEEIIISLKSTSNLFLPLYSWKLLIWCLTTIIHSFSKKRCLLKFFFSRSIAIIYLIPSFSTFF